MGTKGRGGGSVVKHLPLKGEDLSSDPRKPGYSSAHVQCWHSYVRIGVWRPVSASKPKQKVALRLSLRVGGQGAWPLCLGPHGLLEPS